MYLVDSERRMYQDMQSNSDSNCRRNFANPWCLNADKNIFLDAILKNLYGDE
jgi:hypothetical protein